MKLSPLLSLILVTTFSTKAGYFDSFLKTPIRDEAKAEIFFAHLIGGFTYYATDLWKVSTILRKGDAEIAKQKVIECKNDLINNHNSYSKEIKEPISATISILKPDELEFITDERLRKISMLAAVTKVNKDFKLDTNVLSNVAQVYDVIVPATQKKIIAKSKRELHQRAMWDVSAITAISALGYGTCMLINKIS